MNKWEERLCDKNDNRQLLIESSEFTSKIKLNKTLKESLIMQSGKNGTLIVKNVPVTILDRENLNGRIYSTETMRQAIEEAREAMADKQTLGQANEHPESSFVAPTDASHVIINAYIKENINIVVDGKRERHNVLFTDWEVLNTTHGKDLRALFEAECSFGTSIRGVGELNGKMVENYSFISVDGVGNPSSSTYTRMPVSESVKVEFKDANELKENYTVMSSSTNVVRDLSQAGVLQQQLNANPYGTITKTSTKVDQETDPKTGAQTSITTVEADTEDEVNDLSQAFAMAQKAMTNGISKVNSVTIEANEDEDEQGNKTESVGSDNGLEAYVPESAPIEEDDNNLGLKKIVDVSGLQVVGPDEEELWRISDELRKFKDKNAVEWQRSYKSLVDAGVDQIYLDYANGKDMGEGYAAESVITESKKEEPKDPNEGRQYVLKIKDNDPKIEEGAEDEPEFVAMRGNAIRFTKDPKKALHFTQGMEESGIVHYSNIQKLLADMGYGEQNLEKWYKRDENQSTSNNKALSGAVANKPVKNTTMVDPKEESAQLTEAGNTKYSATIELVNKAGLPDMKSLDLSSTDLTSAKEELGNHCDQQDSSSDGRRVTKAILIDNQSKKKYEYKRDTKELVPENGVQAQQPVQQKAIEEPVDNDIKIMNPEEVKLGTKEESADGEIKQNDKTLDMDIDDNTHVEKEFDTQAQASVAKAGIESGKLSGDVLLSDAVKPGWYVAHDKIGISGPYETREACMEGLEDFAEDVSVYEVTESDLNEVLFKNPSKPSDDYVEKPLDEDGEENMFKLHSPNETEGYIEFKQKDNNTFEILWHDNYVPGDDEPTNWVKDIENTEKLYDKLISLGWKGDEFAVDNDFENKKHELERQQYGYDNFGNLEFDNDGYAKLYDPSSDNQDLLFIMRDDGKVEVHGSFEVYNDPIQGKEYEGTTDVLSYDDANEMWKEYQARNGYTKEPRQDEEESVVESSLVPVRFSNIKWDEKDAAYRMFEDIEKDMQISHIEPDVNNANILVEYFENYMNDLNNVSVSYNVNPSDIKESVNYQEEIIRLYNEDSSRQYPRIESADINLG